MLHKLMNKFLGTTLVLVVSFLMLIQAQGLSFEAVKADDWIKIRTVQDLANINNNLKGKYILMNDIDLKAATSTIGGEFYHDGYGWEPIGSHYPKEKHFQGEFNGNGHRITGLTINRSTMYIGLFSFSRDAKIYSLALKDVDIQGGSIVGALFGKSNNSTIEHISVSGNIKGGYEVGGIVGFLNDSSTMAQVYSKTTVEGKRSSIGGIIGRMDVNAKLKDAHSASHIKVSQCGDKATMTCSSGGVVGQTLNSAVVNKAFFEGQLTNNKMAQFDTKDKKFYARPLIGRVNKASLDGLYYFLDYKSEIAESLTKDSINQQSTYSTFDFTNTWYISETARLQNLDYFEPKPTGIKIEQLPNQLEFDEDETIDYSGLEVSLVLSDGSKESVSFSDLWLSLNKKTQQVTVTYKEFTEVFDITIHPVFHYKLFINESGHGGKLVVSKEDIKVHDQEEHRQESVLTIDTQLEPMGRLKSLMLNDEPFTKKTFVIKEESTLEAIFYLLGDVTNNGKLDNNDLKHYVDLIFNQTINEVIDVNEDGKINVADYVTLRQAIIASGEKMKSLRKKSQEQSTVQVESISQQNNQVSTTLTINSNNQAALYFKINPDFKHSNLEVDCNNQCKVETEKNDKAVIISYSNNQNVLEENISTTLKFQVDETKTAKTIKLSDLHFADKSGSSITSLKDMSLVIEQQEVVLPTLKEIILDGKKLTLNFNNHEINYQTNDKKVVIKASSTSSESLVYGEGEYFLKEGNNVIELKVKDKQNQINTYKLYVTYTRKEPEHNSSQESETDSSHVAEQDNKLTSSDSQDQKSKDANKLYDKDIQYSPNNNELSEDSVSQVLPETTDGNYESFLFLLLILGISLILVSFLGNTYKTQE